MTAGNEFEKPTAEEVKKEAQLFLQRFPEFGELEPNEELRASEFARLDDLGHVYVDYTGGGLFGQSQVRRHSELLLGTVLGNPHSSNPTSALATEGVAKCRRRVLEFFKADPEEYVLIFTSNASGALKLVGESYPFGDGDQYLLTYDNHNSVVGIRAFDRVGQAKTRYVPVEPPDMRVSMATLRSFLEGSPEAKNKLFAFPAQSNFSGVQHPLEWIKEAQELGWDVLLDAAAFVPTNHLDLSKWHLGLCSGREPFSLSGIRRVRGRHAELHQPSCSRDGAGLPGLSGDGHHPQPGECSGRVVPGRGGEGSPRERSSGRQDLRTSGSGDEGRHHRPERV